MMPSPPQATADKLHTALGLHQQGHLDQAEALYQEVLQTQPQHADAAQLLGTIALQRKDFALGCALFDKALVFDPHHLQAHINRGHALRHLNRHADALQSFSKALELQPANAEAHNGCGTTLKHLDRHGEALESYRQAVKCRPDFIEAHINIGSALRTLKHYAEAVACYEQVLKIRPDLASAHSNLGNVLLDMKRTKEAMHSYERALALNPNDAKTHNNMGTALLAAEQTEDALTSIERALSIDPSFASAHNQKGQVLMRMHRFEEAVQSFDMAIQLRPMNVATYIHRGDAFFNSIRDEDALESFAQALTLDPDSIDAQCSQALCRLRQGDFERGWQQYHYRLQAESLAASIPRHEKPLWLGKESPDGKTLLVQPEQGFGDVIQFCRYVPLLAARGVQVVLPVHPSLKALLSTLNGVSALVVAGNTLPAFDLYTPMMSLPLAFGTKLNSVPSETPYLFANHAKAKHWQQANLAARPQATRRIGLAWSGNAQHHNDAIRSIPFEQFAAIVARAAGTDCDFVCLHNEFRSDAEKQACLDLGIRTVSEDLKDFSDTAALIESLDLVITVDTSVAHLAGALGKPVWILLQHSPDFRWLLDRSDSPWYPTARLFRQRRFGDWAGVLAEVQLALADFKPAANTPVCRPTDDPLNAALALHQQGHLDKAETSYKDILHAQPRHADAMQLMGTIALQRKDYAGSYAWFDKALAVDPRHLQAHINRGHALRYMQHHGDALQSYAKAIELQPANAEAHRSKGLTLRHLGRLDEAVTAYDHALVISPTDAEAHNGRGTALKNLGLHADAMASYEQAIKHRPTFTEAYNNIGIELRALKRYDEAVASFERLLQIRPDFALAHSNLGNVLLDMKRHGEAIDSYGRAITLNPNDANAHCNLGTALSAVGRNADALASFERARAIDPAFAPIYNNCGSTLLGMHQFARAMENFDVALQLQPDSAEAHCNRGYALFEMMRHDDALQSYARALKINPDFADAHWNEALCKLRLGDFEQGWPKFEWRWKTKIQSDTAPAYLQPVWLGDGSLQGKTLLIHPEQGFGDLFQFCRYVPLLAARGARVVLAVHPTLKEVCSTLKGVSELITTGDTLPAFDLYTPMMSLPLAFKTRLDSVPSETPYLFANRVKVKHWKQKHLLKKPHAGRRIGLAWSGSVKHKNDAIRSIPFEQFTAIVARAAGANCDFVCLHNEFRSDAEKQACLDLGIRTVSEDLKDFSDTAALIESLDLVITVDTSVAHLTGALGKPVWILLQHSPDFRWLLDRSDSPWYPTARLFRQHSFGQWDSVIAEVQSALAADLPSLSNV